MTATRSSPSTHRCRCLLPRSAHFLEGARPGAEFLLLGWSDSGFGGRVLGRRPHDRDSLGGDRDGVARVQIRQGPGFAPDHDLRLVRNGDGDLERWGWMRPRNMWDLRLRYLDDLVPADEGVVVHSDLDPLVSIIGGGGH